MTGATKLGTSTAKATRGRQIPKGRLPRKSVTDWRRRILRTVAIATGLNAAQLSQILGTPERTARRDLLEPEATPTSDDVAQEATADDEKPPGGPATIRKPNGLTPREIADLKSAYRSCQGAGVQEFLDSLQAQAEQ